MITDEWTRSVIRSKPNKARDIRRTAEIMTLQFPEALIEGFEALIPALTLPDPDDRHVLAAAIQAGAHTIITENRKDFPPNILDNYDIEVRTADEFLLSTYELYPETALGCMRNMRRRYNAPSMSVSDFIEALIRARLPMIATEIRKQVDLL